MEDIMARHNTAFLNSFRQMMVGIFGPSVDKHFEQGDSSAAAAVNHLVKMQVFNRLRIVQVFSQLSTWVVNQFGRTLIKQYLIHVRMGKWRSILLESNLSLLTG
jgi:hypothetical protein